MKTLRSLYVNQMYSKNGGTMGVLYDKFVNCRLVVPHTYVYKCDDRRKYVNGGIMISVKSKKKRVLMVIRPVLCSASPVSECEEELEVTETQTQDIPQSKTVHVKLQLQKECLFGETFFVVGDDPMFGSWDPDEAIPMDWSEEHIWSVELDIPVEKPIQYKLLLKGNTGNTLWQPGSDRVLQTWETDKTIIVLEDWENADLQKIMEEGPVEDKNDASVVNSGMLLVGEGLSLQNEEKVDNFVGNSDKATDTSKEANLVNDVSLFNQEDVPVLVPGLTPLEIKEEAPVNQNDRSISMDDIVRPDEPEAKTGTASELNARPREENMTILFRGDELFSIELQRNPEVARVKEQLRSDVKWGIEIVQKFLSNLGIVWHQ